MGKIAVLFAGQGSQYAGMGKDFYESYEEVRLLYEKASDILGYDVSNLCFNPNDLINQTIYTQPAVLLTSLGIYTAFKKELNLKADIFSGFSLGEYSALYASGVFSFENIIKLIKMRATAMDEAANKTKGAMAAVIGLERSVLEALCGELSQGNEFVAIANYNCASQLVIGGTESAVKAACEQAKAKGAKRAIPLNVSGGFHTRLMHSAAEIMYEVIKATPQKAPEVPVIMNCNAKYLDIDKLPELMKTQIESSVFFEDTVRLMIEDGVDTFIEIGPGNVLSGLVRKIDGTKTILNIDRHSDLEKVKEVI